MRGLELVKRSRTYARQAYTESNDGLIQRGESVGEIATVRTYVAILVSADYCNLDRDDY